jgi:hypothetical protein
MTTRAAQRSLSTELASAADLLPRIQKKAAYSPQLFLFNELVTCAMSSPGLRNLEMHNTIVFKRSRFNPESWTRRTRTSRISYYAPTHARVSAILDDAPQHVFNTYASDVLELVRLGYIDVRDIQVEEEFPMRDFDGVEVVKVVMTRLTRPRQITRFRPY